jgi:hypothetical protein
VTFDDDLFASGSYDFPHANEGRKFQPWHRVRKQFVRELVWKHTIQRTFDMRPAARENGSFSYVGLPGADLLDLRYIYREFSQSFDALTYLGIDSAQIGSEDRVRIELSRNEVNSLAKVDVQGSNIEFGNFEDIGKEGSVIAQKYAWFGQADVVNIDLCGNFAEGNPSNRDRSLYDAIRAIIEKQADRRQSWCLLLTTRTDRSSVNGSSLSMLISLIQELLDECPGFDRNMGRHVCTGDELRDVSGLEDSKFSDLMLTAISSWIAGLAFEAKFEVETTAVAKYSVNPSGDESDIVAVGYLFIPHSLSLNDRSGLASQRSSRIPNLCKQVQGLPMLSRNAEVIESNFEADADLYFRLKSESSELLKLARYSARKYSDWCDTVDNYWA